MFHNSRFLKRGNIYMPHGRNKRNTSSSQFEESSPDIEMYLNSELTILKHALDEHAIVIVADFAGNIIEVNDKFCVISGYERAEIMGKNHKFVKSNEHSDAVFVDVWKTISSGHTWYGDIKNTNKTGGDYWVRMTIVPTLDDKGKPLQYVGICVEITDRKQAESLEKSRNHILELITKGEPLPVILNAIVKVIEQNNPAMLCSVLLLDDTGTHLLSGAASRLPNFYNEAIHGLEIGEGVGSCGTAAFMNQRVIVDDIQTHPYWVNYKELARKAGLGSCWSEPIRSTKGKVLGTFAIYHRNINHPTEAHLAVIEQTANMASIAIEKKQAEEKLRRAASVFTHTHEGIIITDGSGSITEVNDAFCSITGYAPKDVIGEHPRIFRSDRQSPEFYAEIGDTLLTQGYWHGEVWNCRKNGEIYLERLTISAENNADGLLQHYISLITDITLMKEHHTQLKRMAHTDALTNLPNRVLLTDRLNQSMVQCQRRNQSLAVAFMDLDGFKVVNDRHGHNVGDELLIKVAQRMKEALREGDTLARIGGDEFIAVMVDLENIEDSKPVLKRLLKAASDPVYLGEAVMQVSASIGVSFYPQNQADADLLVRHADHAMYIAKQAGKNSYHFFDTAQDNASKTLGQSIGDIRSALDKCEFVLHYQPKVNMHNGEVIGVEALIRWQHPVRGLVPPLEFLPAIEGHAVSLELGEWVIDAALTRISQWHSIGVKLAISVNISAYQLQQRNFSTRLAALLAAHLEVDPHYLELEILETSVLSDISQVFDTMCACHDLGVRFSLDDFGTGYSSLTHIKRLPAYLIKIDQSFVHNMLEDADDLSIVESVIGLAKAFKREVIAEGVETIEHGVALMKLGCELAQGYGIARPMPAKDIPEWLDTWKPHDSWLAYKS
jgi:diguanylate cyclase (GGDEF)-like protein/PAS domain S-box-containing protein